MRGGGGVIAIMKRVKEKKTREEKGGTPYVSHKWIQD